MDIGNIEIWLASLIPYLPVFSPDSPKPADLDALNLLTLKVNPDRFPESSGVHLDEIEGDYFDIFLFVLF